jgi:hypothetical protein
MLFPSFAHRLNRFRPAGRSFRTENPKILYPQKGVYISAQGNTLSNLGCYPKLELFNPFGVLSPEGSGFRIKKIKGIIKDIVLPHPQKKGFIYQPRVTPRAYTLSEQLDLINRTSFKGIKPVKTVSEFSQNNLWNLIPFQGTMQPCFKGDFPLRAAEE